MNDVQGIFQSMPTKVTIEQVFKTQEQQTNFVTKFSQEMKAELSKNEIARRKSEQKSRSLFVG